MLPCAHPALLSYWESVFSLECDRTWYSADFLFSVLTSFTNLLIFSLLPVCYCLLSVFCVKTWKTSGSKTIPSCGTTPWQAAVHKRTGSAALGRQVAVEHRGEGDGPDLISQQGSLCLHTDWWRERERIKTIEYCGMSCSELGHDQSKLKCSFSYSLSPSFSFLPAFLTQKDCGD